MSIFPQGPVTETQTEISRSWWLKTKAVVNSFGSPCATYRDHSSSLRTATSGPPSLGLRPCLTQNQVNELLSVLGIGLIMRGLCPVANINDTPSEASAQGWPGGQDSSVRLPVHKVNPTPSVSLALGRGDISWPGGRCKGVYQQS